MIITDYDYYWMTSVVPLSTTQCCTCHHQPVAHQSQDT